MIRSTFMIPNKKSNEILEIKGLTKLKKKNILKKFFSSRNTNILNKPAEKITINSLTRKLIISGEIFSMN